MPVQSCSCALVELLITVARSCTLVELPPEIGLCRHLETMSLICNSLSAIPAEVGMLKELGYLYLKLASFASKCSNLDASQKLSFNHAFWWVFSARTSKKGDRSHQLRSKSLGGHGLGAFRYLIIEDSDLFSGFWCQNISSCLVDWLVRLVSYMKRMLSLIVSVITITTRSWHSCSASFIFAYSPIGT